MPLPQDFAKLHADEAAMELRMLKVKYARSPSAAYRDSMKQEQYAIRANFNLGLTNDLPAVHFLEQHRAKT